MWLVSNSSCDAQAIAPNLQTLSRYSFHLGPAASAPLPVLYAAATANGTSARSISYLSSHYSHDFPELDDPTGNLGIPLDQGKNTTLMSGSQGGSVRVGTGGSGGIKSVRLA